MQPLISPLDESVGFDETKAKLPGSVVLEADRMTGTPMEYVSQRYTLIDGEFTAWSGPTQKVETPYFVSGKQIAIGEYPLLDRAHGLLAVEAASKAYDSGMGEWPQLSVEQRIAALEEFLTRMIAKRDEVSALIMAETAKPLELSYKEFDRTVEYIHKTISAYRELTWQEGVDQPYGHALQAHIERTPLGVTLCMSPFNYPLNETFTSLIPALIMGNTTVVKPARFGVLLFEPLLSAFQECFPPGVVNLRGRSRSNLADHGIRFGGHPRLYRFNQGR
jgi:glyceraldehyde-3-phosphate dehydrogenase (NADP+)